MILTALAFLGVAAAALASSGGVYDIDLIEVYSFLPAQGAQKFDVLYFFEVFIGTPPQQFTLLADTGSPDTWVQGKKLFNDPIYTPNKSSTFHNNSKPWLFQYSGPDKSLITFSSGYSARDTVGIGNSGSSSISLQNTTFAVAEKTTTSFSPFAEGIFGLAYNAYASALNTPVYVQNLINHGKLSQSLFGLRITRAQNAQPNAPPGMGKFGYNNRTGAGKLRLGGVDDTLFTGPITYVPVQQHTGLWQFAIDGIYVNGNLVENSPNHNAIADVGTTGLAFPPKMTANFFKPLNGTRVKSSEPPQLYTVPCNTTVDVQIKIGGTLFPIKAQDLNAGYADKSKQNCNTNVAGVVTTNASPNGTYPSNATDVLVLGTTFLINTYTVFDYTHGGRIGFAQLLKNGPLPADGPIDVAELR